MATLTFKKATKEQAKLRLALIGIAGSGKTYTALNIATLLTPGSVAVIDTEHGSASLYADLFDFDVIELSDFHPKRYMEAMNAAVAAAYQSIVIDSLSHAWMGKGGILEIVDTKTAASSSKNQFTSGWKEATPIHQEFIEAMLRTNAHLIVTIRSKTEYVLETRNGKSEPRKVGMAPVQRDGMEYEFSVVGDMDADNTYTVTKTRCAALKDAVIHQPGAEFVETLRTWLTAGAPVHWAKNGGGESFNMRRRELGISWEVVAAILEPEVTLERLSDTTLTYEQAMSRLESLAQKAGNNHVSE